MIVFAVAALACCGAAVAWLLAAFVLRVNGAGRWAFTTLLPMLCIWASVSGYAIATMNNGPDPAETRGGIALFIVYGFLLGCLATVPSIATVFLLESKFGWRAR